MERVGFVITPIEILRMWCATAVTAAEKSSPPPQACNFSTAADIRNKHIKGRRSDTLIGCVRRMRSLMKWNEKYPLWPQRGLHSRQARCRVAGHVGRGEEQDEGDLTNFF